MTAALRRRLARLVVVVSDAAYHAVHAVARRLDDLADTTASSLDRWALELHPDTDPEDWWDTYPGSASRYLDEVEAGTWPSSPPDDEAAGLTVTIDVDLEPWQRAVAKAQARAAGLTLDEAAERAKARADELGELLNVGPVLGPRVLPPLNLPPREVEEGELLVLGAAHRLPLDTRPGGGRWGGGGPAWRSTNRRLVEAEGYPQVTPPDGTPP